MTMTLSEKIIARASGLRRVSPGDIVEASIDLAMFNDLTGPLAIEVMGKIGVDRVWSSSKLVVVLDHLAPANSIEAASLHKKLREFAEKHSVRLYDVGRGVCHQVLVEEGYVKPGMLIIGADSHTCTAGALGAFATGVGSSDIAAAMITGKIWLKVPETMKIACNGVFKPKVMAKDLILHIIGTIGADGANYKAIEFTGSVIKSMSIDSRLTICNMAIEAGAKTGIVVSDEVTLMYLRSIGVQDIKSIYPDSNAEYVEVVDVDVSSLDPMVSCPSSVDNVKSVREVEGVEVDQVFIGSCTNGRLEDLKVAAEIMENGKVNPKVRCLIIPASIKVYMEALRLGLIDVFMSSGAIVCNPTCGPCFGGHLGLLAEGEVCVSSSNRNFTGRMGHKNSKVYLASPATCAASALTGRITDPRCI